MNTLTKLKIEKKIAALLGLTAASVNFQESRIITPTDVMIKANGVWFDADNTAAVYVAQ